jgi:hypothetical protein
MPTKKTTKKTTTTKQEFKDYNDYLNSEKWKELREEALDRDFGFCKICLDKVATQVHHHKYPRDYNNDNINNLISVCESCHEKVHNLYNSNCLLNSDMGLFPHESIRLIVRETNDDDKLIFNCLLVDDSAYSSIGFKIASDNINHFLDIFNCLKKSLTEEDNELA